MSWLINNFEYFAYTPLTRLDARTDDAGRLEPPWEKPVTFTPINVPQNLPMVSRNICKHC